MRAYTVKPRQASQKANANPTNENPTNLAGKITASQSQDPRELAAGATNDAIRDWNLVTGELTWPQGLVGLLGYAEVPSTIGFWQKRLHVSDRSRVAVSLREALESDTTSWTAEYRFQHAEGHYLHLLERAAIVRDKNAKAIRLVGALMDVTARKHLQDQLAHSQKMEAFGQLAGGVAHDFNNFLTAILGYSDLIVAEIQGRGTVAKYVSEIRSAAGRASALTHHLLAFSRRQELEPRVLEVNSLISNLERSILRLLGEHISVICELLPAKAAAHIKVDPNQFTQIIVNLAVNARDAMPAGGKLILATSAVALDPALDDTIPPTLAAGEYVVVSMTDDGVGMSDEVKARIFEPFFTTKEDGHGSGLGLAACYGIIRQSGGHISLESELGHGTTIHIYLPKVEAPPPPAYRRPSAKKLPTGTESVLVVDDEVAVRHVAVRTLRMLGYDVTEAFRASDAKRRIVESHIDLILIDMVLPDMRGRAFADWIRAHSPHTRIILCSGYLPESSQHCSEAKDEDIFLAKPFDQEQLAAIVRQTLDAKPTR